MQFYYKKVKVKSDWWFKAGYCGRFRDESRDWKAAERRRMAMRQQKMWTRGQRLAIKNLHVYKPEDIFSVLEHARKLEVVYDRNGKIAVVIASFKTEADMETGLAMVKNAGWLGSKAYSYRTRRKYNRRVEVFMR